MNLKVYDRSENEQINELIELNQHCLELLEEESYENLLSLFEERDRLTRSLITGDQVIENTSIVSLLDHFDKAIIEKVEQKKRDCAESLSAFYRQNDAHKSYIETSKGLIDSIYNNRRL